MADANPKSKGKAAEESKEAKGFTINLSFYDSATLKPLAVPEKPPIWIGLASEDGKKTTAVPLQTKKEIGQFIEVPADVVTSPGKPEPKVAEIETGCGPEPDTQVVVLTGFADEEGNSQPASIDCEPQQMMSTAVFVAGSQKSLCTTAQIALEKIQESYTFSLIAYDRSIGDYIRNPEALLDDVKLEIREVEGPKAASGTTSTFRARSYSAVTQDGRAQITGLTFGQQYEVMTSAPSGYTSTYPLARRLVAGSGSIAQWVIAYDPCGECATRSVVFVNEGCEGARMANLSFSASGVTSPKPAGKNGIWDIPAGTTGQIVFQSSGKVFSPPSIDLEEDSSVVFIVKVGDQNATTAVATNRQRFHFVDERGTPFRHRPLQLKSPAGRTEIVRTDHEGYFDAEEGWIASAPETEDGHAVEAFPLLTRNVG